MAQQPTNLTQTQMDAFDAQMQKYGQSPGALSFQALNTSGRNGPTILSSDPAESHVPPVLLPVQDIAHLKQLAGVPDEHYTQGLYTDRAIDYPDPPHDRIPNLLGTAKDKCDLEYSLSSTEMGDVSRAATAYIQGDSSKVKSYEPLINALMFPTKVALFTGASVVVTPGSPLVLQGPDPVVLNCQSITVDPGGQIIVKTQAQVVTQAFTAD